MRRPRKKILSAEYHVIAKINCGEFLMAEDNIKRLMLKIIRRAKRKYKFHLRNFCIMGTHIHLMIKPLDQENLSRIMQWILSVFAMQYNSLLQRHGHVWYDRFKSFIIESGRQWLHTFMYIAHNPVKAGIVTDITDYRFSGMWFYRKKQYHILEPPNNSVKEALANLGYS